MVTDIENTEAIQPNEADQDMPEDREGEKGGDREGQGQKGNKLLSELKQAKAKVTEAHAALNEARAAQEALQRELDHLKRELHRDRLERPVDALVKEIAAEHLEGNFLEALQQHYRFELGEDKKPRIVDLDGKPAMLTNRPAEFCADDVREVALSTGDEKFKAFIRAPDISGGGSMGYRHSGKLTIPSDQRPEEKPKQFGLR